MCGVQSVQSGANTEQQRSTDWHRDWKYYAASVLSQVPGWSPQHIWRHSACDPSPVGYQHSYRIHRRVWLYIRYSHKKVSVSFRVQCLKCSILRKQLPSNPQPSKHKVEIVKWLIATKTNVCLLNFAKNCSIMKPCHDIIVAAHAKSYQTIATNNKLPQGVLPSNVESFGD